MTTPTPRADVLPLGPYRVVWPDEQGGLFTVWGREDQRPPEGWAIPLVAAGMQSVMEWLADHLNALAATPGHPEPGLREALREAIGFTDEEHGLEHWHYARGGRTSPDERAGVFVDRQQVLDAIDEVLR